MLTLVHGWKIKSFGSVALYRGVNIKIATKIFESYLVSVYLIHLPRLTDSMAYQIRLKYFSEYFFLPLTIKKLEIIYSLIHYKGTMYPTAVTVHSGPCSYEAKQRDIFRVADSNTFSSYLFYSKTQCSVCNWKIMENLTLKYVNYKMLEWLSCRLQQKFATLLKHYSLFLEVLCLQITCLINKSSELYDGWLRLHEKNGENQHHFPRVGKWYHKPFYGMEGL